ncbi:hypothetical protein [Lactobacillus acidipiscis] [Lactiplantibacillus mudanjiangensis]|uniref:LURP-one-related/scramblase family protein n=1 Tax=Lactiplantibacillus mudanjiangensis TaxID=1296538 RepID=UPI00101564F3|nr:hypothetical protein [Lactobacillus acidipiscis] [Lactiplantibacillus mudanjiangensis]
MRQLYINQKIFSLRDKFAVIDAAQQPVYQVIGSLFKIPKHFDILDQHEKVVATVTNQPFTLLPKLQLTIDGRQAATIKKQFTLFKPRYSIDALGMTITGDFWDMNFDVRQGSHVVGTVAKKWLSFGDQYELTINDYDSELLLVGLVIAIDYVKQQEQAATSNSNT